jgi:FlaA1/EpsC-like NDP-sugar epimerase
VSKRLIIIGAGGHGAVVAEAATAAGHWREVAMLDDRYPEHQSIVGFPVVGSVASYRDFLDESCLFSVAIGENSARLALSR